jgi:hypothetical protein
VAVAVLLACCFLVAVTTRFRSRFGSQRSLVKALWKPSHRDDGRQSSSWIRRLASANESKSAAAVAGLGRPNENPLSHLSLIHHQGQPFESLRLLESRILAAITQQYVGDLPSLSSEECRTQGLSPFVLDLQTDFYGNEISWTLKSQRSGQVLGSVNPKTYQDLQHYSQIICVPTQEECFRFTISDHGRDGLCCQTGKGFYSVSLNGRQIGSSDGDRFQTEDIIEFGACGANGDNTEIDTDTIIVPEQNETDTREGKNTLPQVICTAEEYALELNVSTDDSGPNAFVQIQDMSTNLTVLQEEEVEAQETFTFYSCFAQNTCYNLTIVNGNNGSHSLSINDGLVVPVSIFTNTNAVARRPDTAMKTTTVFFGDCKPTTKPPSGLDNSTTTGTTSVVIPPFQIVFTFKDEGQDSTIPLFNAGQLNMVESATTRYLETELSQLYPDQFLMVDLEAHLTRRRRRRLRRHVRALQSSPGSFGTDTVSTGLIVRGDAFFVEGAAPTEEELQDNLQHMYASSNKYLDQITADLKEMGEGRFDGLLLTSATSFQETSFQEDLPIDVGSPSHHQPINNKTKTPSKALVIAVTVATSLAIAALVVVYGMVRARRRPQNNDFKAVGTAALTFSVGESKKTGVSKQQAKMQVEKSPSDVGLCDMQQGIPSSEDSDSSSPSMNDHVFIIGDEDDVAMANEHAGPVAKYKERVQRLKRSSHFSKETIRLQESVLGVTIFPNYHDKRKDDPNEHQFHREDFESDNDFGHGGAMFI